MRLALQYKCVHKMDVVGWDVVGKVGWRSDWVLKVTGGASQAQKKGKLPGSQDNTCEGQPFQCLIV